MTRSLVLKRSAGDQMLRYVLVLGLAMTPTFATPSFATETVTYSYDALGRLIRTVKSGGPSTGVDAQVGYDKVGNRINVTVTGANSNPPPSPPTSPSRLVVIPFNGKAIVVIN